MPRTILSSTKTTFLSLISVSCGASLYLTDFLLIASSGMINVLPINGFLYKPSEYLTPNLVAKDKAAVLDVKGTGITTSTGISLNFSCHLLARFCPSLNLALYTLTSSIFASGLEKYTFSNIQGRNSFCKITFLNTFPAKDINTNSPGNISSTCS